MAVIMQNPITGTRGVMVSDLPEDWTEAEMELRSAAAIARWITHRSSWPPCGLGAHGSLARMLAT